MTFALRFGANSPRALIIPLLAMIDPTTIAKKQMAAV
jgi:hypothetical protein